MADSSDVPPNATSFEGLSEEVKTGFKDSLSPERCDNREGFTPETSSKPVVEYSVN